MNSFLINLLQTALDTLLDVAPIILTLFFFQYVVLKQSINHIGRVFMGLSFVISGLTLFLVGLNEAIFPLGDTMARQLTDPEFLYGSQPHTYLWYDYGWVYLFGFLIGFSTTLAEPALIAVASKAQDISGGQYRHLVDVLLSH